MEIRRNASRKSLDGRRDLKEGQSSIDMIRVGWDKGEPRRGNRKSDVLATCKV